MSVTPLQCLAKVSCYVSVPGENVCTGQRVGKCCGGHGCKSGRAALKLLCVEKWMMVTA